MSEVLAFLRTYPARFGWAVLGVLELAVAVKGIALLTGWNPFLWALS